MATRRQRRVAQFIHEEIGILLERRISDPRLAAVTITDVEITPDLRIATIYYSVLGDEQEQVDLAQAGLEHASGFFRRELGEVLDLRYVPELRFRFDETLREARHLDQLLDSLHEGE